MWIQLLVVTLTASAIASGTDLTPQQALSARRLSHLQVAPDGGRVAFTVEEPAEGAGQNRDVWVLDPSRGEPRRYTTSPQSDSHPRWSPDGKLLAFLSDRGGSTQIYLLRMAGGEAFALTEGENAVKDFEWSPDGKQIAYLAPEAKTEEEEKRETEKDDARVVDRDDRHPVLWLADCDSRKVRRLVSPPWRVSEVAWMPDGERLLVVATDHLQPELLTERIFSVRLRDGGMEEVAAPAPPFRDVKVSPDGGSFAYVGVRGDGPVGHDLFVQPLDDDDDDDDDEDGEARNLTGGSLDRPVRSYAWGREGLLHVLAQTGFGNTLFTITPEGALKREEKLDVHPTSFAVGPGLLAFAGETTTKPSELWLARSGGKAERMTHLNEERAELSPVAPEILRYKSFDGTEIEAGLLKPPGSGPFPTVVLVHGGPSGRWGDFFDPLGQLLVSGGLAVLYPNVRGSTGYGERFLEMNRHDWGGGDFKDVMAGVDFLIERGVAHRERLGIGGWSYGGYMAAWAVTQTDRFRAAVSGAPMTDLASEYGTEMSSINAYDTWFLGTPYENLSLFIERSPVTHVKNARTPTLILCGEKDTTDPLGQCQQFYRGLKRYRVETELVVYPREGHGIREEKHRIDRLQRFVGWFEKYLK